MIKLKQKQKDKANAFAEEFKKKYLETDQGRKHIDAYEKEREDVKRRFEKIREKFNEGKDITDDVLYGLLPYLYTRHNIEHNHRVSTWPAVTKDVKTWFEKAGWQRKENWPNVAKVIFNLIDGLVKTKDSKYIEVFLKSEYSKGFQAGMITPILYCLKIDFLVINSKTVDTVNFILEENVIDNRLENYFENIERIRTLLKSLEIPLLDSYDTFDAFCHWMCDKRLGGYARLKREEEETPLFEEKVEISNHEDAMRILIELGNILAYDTYVAHPSKKSKDQKLGELTTSLEVPEHFKGIKGINRIDVIWFSKQRDKPSYFFEVEDKGTMREALHRLYQVMMLNARIFIISPIETLSKFEKWVDTAPYRDVKEKYKFRSYDDLIKFFKEAKSYYKIRNDFIG